MPNNDQTTNERLERAEKLLKRTYYFHAVGLKAIGPTLDMEDSRVKELVELHRDIRVFLGENKK